MKWQIDVQRFVIILTGKMNFPIRYAFGQANRNIRTGKSSECCLSVPKLGPECWP
jgi:hypothetical protein